MKAKKQHYLVLMFLNFWNIMIKWVCSIFYLFIYFFFLICDKFTHIGNDNDIRAFILQELQHLHRGMGILPRMQICLPQPNTLLIQKTKTGIFSEIISWPCRGHLVYITWDFLTQPGQSQQEWKKAVGTFHYINCIGFQTIF